MSVLSTAQAEAHTRSGVFQALRFPGFRVLWFGLMGVSTGTWLQNVALAAWMQKQHHHSLDPASIGAVQILPLLVLMLAGGRLADRFDKCYLLMATHLAFACCSIALALCIDRAGSSTRLLILAISFLNGCILAIDHPTRQAIVPQLVPRTALVNAVALNSLTFVGAAAFGPAFAAPFIAQPIAAVCYLRAALMLMMILGLVVIRRFSTLVETKHEHPEQAPPATKRPVPIKHLWFGLSTDVRKLLILLAITELLVGSCQGLLPRYALEVFHQGAGMLGRLRCAAGIGSLAGGLLLAVFLKRHGSVRLAVISALLFAAMTMLFGLSAPHYVSFIFLATGASFALISQATIEGHIQLRTPAEQRGRTMSLFSLCVVALSQVGALPLALLSDRLLKSNGIRAAAGYTTAGSALAALVLIAIFLAHHIWRKRQTLSRQSLENALPIGRL